MTGNSVLKLETIMLRLINHPKDNQTAVEKKLLPKKIQNTKNANIMHMQTDFLSIRKNREKVARGMTVKRNPDLDF